VATLPSDHGITADLACETARMVVQLRQEIAPAPASDKCENCGGTGKLGDGRIVTKCPVCDGTGKKPKSVCKDCPK
jgi:DnaJ-class molecular chaperone